MAVRWMDGMNDGTVGCEWQLDERMGYAWLYRLTLRLKFTLINCYCEHCTCRKLLL